MYNANTMIASSTNQAEELDYGTETGELVSYIRDIFEAFKTSRLPWEELWEECWYNFLGQYQANTRWKPETEGIPGKSKVFIKITTLKCNTAHSKLVDVLFTGKMNLPFDLEPVDYMGNARVPQDTKDAISQAKEVLRDHFRRVELEEVVDTGILELTILGSAVLKGPIIELQKGRRLVQKTIAGIPVNQLDKSLSPYEFVAEDEVVPVIDHVPLWEYYVDANAKKSSDSIGEIHFQRLLPAKFKMLAHQGGYRADAVAEAARRATATDDSDTRYIQLADNYTGTQGDKDDRVSVLEYWGLVPVRLLRAENCEGLPEDANDEDSIEALVVLAADGVVIKCCVNPLGFRPFFVCPYKKRPHVIYGMGVAEMMRDSQKMINSSARMIIDNKAISGNGMVAVNIDRINTKRTKNLKVYTGKTWYVKGNFAPKEAVDSISFNDVTNGLRELMEMFERFSDEETGIPKYTHGQQDSFLNKTAAGMSMLMTQANINLKSVLKNIDNYWIEPVVEAFYAWFMEMQPESGVGQVPVKVKAIGSDSLIAKELKMENYMKFYQITQNPQDAIFTDRPKFIRTIANILETEDIVRSKEEIEQIMAEMSNRDNAPKDVREMVDLDRLYPMLARSEQVQILEMLGIQPDPNGAVPQQLPRPTPGSAAAGTGGF